MLAYLQSCLDRGLFPLCRVPSAPPQLGLILGLYDPGDGPIVPVLCLATGILEEYSPAVLDPYDPAV